MDEDQSHSAPKEASRDKKTPADTSEVEAENKSDENSSEVSEETSVSSDDATLLMRIEGMIKTHISQIDNLTEEATKYESPPT